MHVIMKRKDKKGNIKTNKDYGYEIRDLMFKSYNTVLSGTQVYLSYGVSLDDARYKSFPVVDVVQNKENTIHIRDMYNEEYDITFTEEDFYNLELIKTLQRLMNHGLEQLKHLDLGKKIAEIQI